MCIAQEKKYFFYQIACLFGINLYLCCANTLGLTGFDSRLEWYVSTRSVGWWLLNPNGHQIYLATTTMLSLPKRSTVVYWLNSVTR